MTENEKNSQYVQKLEKFLFLFKTDTLASQCFLFSLKRTQQFLSIFGFFGSFYGIYLGIIADSLFDKIHHIGMDIASFILCFLILLSTFNYNVSHAYYGYLISFTRSALYLLINTIRMLVESRDKDNNYLIKRASNGFINTLIVIYFTWVNYSYTKRLALRQYDVIEGKKQENKSE
jgi:hypothetical protein